MVRRERCLLVMNICLSSLMPELSVYLLCRPQARRAPCGRRRSWRRPRLLPTYGCSSLRVADDLPDRRHVEGLDAAADGVGHQHLGEVRIMTSSRFISACADRSGRRAWCRHTARRPSSRRRRGRGCATTPVTSKLSSASPIGSMTSGRSCSSDSCDASPALGDRQRAGRLRPPGVFELRHVGRRRRRRAAEQHFHHPLAAQHRRRAIGVRGQREDAALAEHAAAVRSAIGDAAELVADTRECRSARASRSFTNV